MIGREELAAHYASGDPVYSDANRHCLDYYYTRLRELIEARFSQPGRIYDVGCSGGWFLDVMMGWERHGCEIVPADAENARSRYGDRIFEGAFEEYSGPDEYFDVVTLQDVFDHCPDPMAVLSKCRGMLKEGGLLVIKVHNISCLYAKLTGPNFYPIIPPSHLFYYDRGTLGQAAARSGFEVVQSKFIGHRLLLTTVFSRLSRGDKKSVAHRIHLALAGSRLGNISILKNLHDIITILAVKRSAPEIMDAEKPE
jgi:SAM-dependent methyltransferase